MHHQANDEQQRIVSTPEPLTIVPQAAVSNPTYNFGISWTNSFRNLTGVGSYAHYQRNIGGSTFQVQSNVPLVRVKCNEYANFTNPNDTVQYPYLPLHGSAPGISYVVPKESYLNSTLPATSWRVPNTTYDLTNGSTVSESPTAFVNLQIPSAGNFTNWGAFMACSVDARWINTTIVGEDFNQDAVGSYFVYAQMPDSFLNPSPDSGFPYTDGAIKVDADSDWLTTLTPAFIPYNVPDFNATHFPGYTTLADILDAMRLDDGFTDLGAIMYQIESVVATVVADGMSRVGYSINGGDQTLAGRHDEVVIRYNVSFDPPSPWSKAAYKGTASTPFVPGYDESNSTLFRFDAYLQGYSYKADSTTYWLALALFYVHALIVLCHLGYRLFLNRESSVAWEGLMDMLALALVSEPPRGDEKDSLRNTCGGIDSFNTFAVKVGARVAENDEEELSRAQEQIQLYIGDNIRKRGLRQVAPDLPYGANI